MVIRLHIGAQEKIIEGLRSGAYDLAICYVQGLSASIDHVALLPDLYPRAVLPRSHRLASRTSLSLSMLADDDLILLDIWPSNEYFLTLFDEAGVTPRVAYRVPSIELVRGLVGQGLGFSVLVTEPPHGMTFDGEQVVTIPLTDRMIPSRTVMAWHGSTALTRLTRTFLHHCQTHIEIPPHIAPPDGYVAAPIPPGFTGKPSKAKILS